MEQILVGDSNCGGGSRRKGKVVVSGASLRFDTLPEDCISKVISHTSPRDACVVASVSKIVKSAAQSDFVWETFLPAEYSSRVPRSLNQSSKKEIYKSLTEEPVLIDDGKKSLWLEKSNGKKCYMLSAMELTIIWGDSPAYWQWITDPESKFEKVAELRNVCWFEIRGKISCRKLSKGTHYSVYLVFKRAGSGSHGFNYRAFESGVGFVGKEVTKTFAYLEPLIRPAPRRPRWLHPREQVDEENGRDVKEPNEREDGWYEVELGKFYINNGDCDDDEIEISLMETKMGNWKSGLVFQGIEIRALKQEEMVMDVSTFYNMFGSSDKTNKKEGNVASGWRKSERKRRPNPKYTN